MRRSSNLERKLRFEMGRKFERSSGGKLNFLSRGVTMACFRSVGKVDPSRQRLRNVVIGGKRASKQDLRRKVGMMSSEQEEPGEERMILLTSSIVVGAKFVKMGGGAGGEMCGVERIGFKDERSLLILPLKRLRKAEGS